MSLRNPVLVAASLAFVIGLAAILGAWGFQLIGHYVPCKLCLQERIPYYVGLPVLLFAALAAASGARVAHQLLLMAAGMVFAAGFLLGAYHAGFEWGLWPGPTDCGATSGGATGQTVNELMRQLENIKIVSCSEASWRLLGLSFAGWNAVVSFIVAALAIWAGTKKTGAAS